MTDRFAGGWMVSEYVHQPDGTFVGIVEQRRIVEPKPDGTLRVIQQCAPDAALSNHPMGKFAGEWEFDLRVDGRARRYLGPDVIGTGIQWADGIMTGRGLWPRFGHSFTSYGALITPTRQITGGKFMDGGEVIAVIVGIAVQGGNAFPRFADGSWPAEGVWIGTDRQRIYASERCGWQDTELDTGDGLGRVDLNWRGASADVRSTWYGTAKHIGAMLEMQLIADDSATMLDVMSLYDAETQTVIEIRQHYVDHVLSGVEVIRLAYKG